MRPTGTHAPGTPTARWDRSAPYLKHDPPGSAEPRLSRAEHQLQHHARLHAAHGLRRRASTRLDAQHLQVPARTLIGAQRPRAPQRAPAAASAPGPDVRANAAQRVPAARTVPLEHRSGCVAECTADHGRRRPLRDERDERGKHDALHLQRSRSGHARHAKRWTWYGYGGCNGASVMEVRADSRMARHAQQRLLAEAHGIAHGLYVPAMSLPAPLSRHSRAASAPSPRTAEARRVDCAIAAKMPQQPRRSIAEARTQRRRSGVGAMAATHRHARRSSGSSSAVR